MTVEDYNLVLTLRRHRQLLEGLNILGRMAEHC